MQRALSMCSYAAHQIPGLLWVKFSQAVTNLWYFLNSFINQRDLGDRDKKSIENLSFMCLLLINHPLNSALDNLFVQSFVQSFTTQH